MNKSLYIVWESNGEELIPGVILSSEMSCNSMGKRGHFSDGIYLELGNDIKGNDMCNDWMETFHEYGIDDQLDGSVRHFLENNEEFLGILKDDIDKYVYLMYLTNANQINTNQDQ